MNRLVAVVIALAVVVYIFFSSIFIVDERQQAIVMRFGQITDVKTEPGLYFKIPTDFVDTVMFVEDRLLRYDLANMTVQVSGGAFYEVDAFLTYKIVNPRLFRERALGDLRVAEQRIGARFSSALRDIYGLRSFSAALSAERQEMMDEARDLIRPGVAELGIDVVDVRILRTDLSSEVSERTFERMKAERLAEAAGLRARGQEAAQSLRAVADREQVGILAAARRDAEVLRGEGDAERNSIYAGAYSQDPEFFEFYRSMESYRTSLSNTGTTMVLSPDTEFFRYFAGAGDSPAAVTPPAPAADAVAPEAAPAAPALEAPAPEAPALEAAPAAPEPAAPAANP